MRVSSLPWMLLLLSAVCAASLVCGALLPLQLDGASDFYTLAQSQEIDAQSQLDADAQSSPSAAFLLAQPIELSTSDTESQWSDVYAASPSSFDAAAAVNRDDDSPLSVLVCKRSESRILKARGAGIENVPTDKAEVRAVIEEHRDIDDPRTKGDALRKVASEVQRTVAARASEVVDFLQRDRSVSKKISKLRTSAVSLHPQYSWQNQTRRLTGYTASTTLTFQIETADAGAVLDSIVQKGVSSIDRLRFFTSPSVLESARKRALASALRDALSQARAIVAELRSSAPDSLSPKKKLRVLKIEVSQLTAPGGRDLAVQSRSFRRARMASEEESAAVPQMPIVAEEQQVSAAIVVKIGY